MQTWADGRFNDHQIGWPNIFYSLDELKTYKQEFFGDRKDLVILGLSFAETEMTDLIEKFEPKQERQGEIGIRYGLRQAWPENPNGKFLGYDLICIELDGSFHTMHYLNLQKELETQFGLAFNTHGLILDCKDWGALMDYFNDDETGLESVPWYYCKVKEYR